jgi:general stress protein 26
VQNLNSSNFDIHSNDQQLSDYDSNTRSKKGYSIYFKRSSQIMPDGTETFRKISEDSFNFPNNSYFESIEPSRLKSIHIKYKVDQIINFIKDFDVSTLTTVSSAMGGLKSRQMYIYGRIQDLYFCLLAQFDSGIISDIKNDSRVNLTFSRKDRKFVKWCSISGTADAITDSKIVANLWSPTVKTWLNNLGDGLNNCTKSDPRIVCIFIETQSIKYSVVNNNQQTLTPLKKIYNAIGSSKQAKYSSDTTCHLLTEDINDYISNYCQLE